MDRILMILNKNLAPGFFFCPWLWAKIHVHKFTVLFRIGLANQKAKFCVKLTIKKEVKFI